MFINAVAKPGLKSLLAGDVGTGPGTGQFVCTAQQLPVAPVMTSNSDCAGSPSFSASTKASPMAICCTANTMLLHNLAACPAPDAPQWIILPARGSSTGVARANADSSPPTMNASVPAVAPLMPPDTGASIWASPRSVACALTARASSTEIVDVSISSAPDVAAGTTSA